MNNHHHELGPLDEALWEFEQAVLSPVVPGELVSWTESATAATATLQQALKQRVSDDHPRVLDAIAEADTELISRVEQLREEDTHLVESIAEVREAADRMHSLADDVEPQEDVFSELLDWFQTKAEGLAIRIKKQEQAIDTWYQEASQRDRGPVD